MEQFKTIRLSAGNNLIIDNASDAFRVDSGVVLIYIVSLDGKSVGRRTFLCEAKCGEVIPAFNYTDRDGLKLCFCFSSRNAEVAVMHGLSTKVLRRRFAEKAGINHFEIEGYDEAVAEKFRLLSVLDEGYLMRRNKNDENVSNGIASEITNAFSRKKNSKERTDNSLYNALAVICGHSDIELVSYDELNKAGFSDPQLDDIASLSGFAYREIKLEDNWFDQNIGALLVFDEQGAPVACLPVNNRCYRLYTKDGRIVRADRACAEKLRSRAYVFYRPLPPVKLSRSKIFAFWIKSLKITAVLKYYLVSLITAVIALSIPIISRELYNLYIPLGLGRILLELGALLTGLMAANVLFSIVRQLSLFGQSSKVGYDFQNAVIHRLVNLPQSFFRRYDSAELAVGVSTASSSSGKITGELISLVMSAFIACIYFACMLYISPIMSAWGVAALLFYSAVYLVLTFFVSERSCRYADADARTTAVLVRLIRGVDKLKTSAAEEQAFLNYLEPYLKERALEEKTEHSRGYMRTLSLASSGLFALLFYSVCYFGNFDIGAGEFIAFISVFGGLAGYVTIIINSVADIRSEIPVLKRLKPIFDEEPENMRSKYVLNRFENEIRLENVSFSYGKEPVLRNINLTIKKGEYVALTGASGSGKSTLIKLLLGFEKPTEGRILYDGYNLEDLNKKLLRKNIGAVLQDSHLIAGSIYDNITVSRPDASLAEVSAAVKLCALDEDIKKMPMGLHTILSEENSMLSEGQKQRILIARAIVSNPDILVLDEATSALDNRVQGIVTDTLKKSSATKIAAAHRLSTVMECDRVIVIENGRAVEQGSPAKLLKENGLFARLAQRQTGGYENE